MAISQNRYDIPLSASRWDRLAFRVGHWLLSPGTSDVAKLRGYLRVRDWRKLRSTRERLRALKAAVKLPARAARTSRQAVVAYGEAVARDFGVSPGRQFANLWWLAVRHGMEPHVYYRYSLYRPGQLRRAPQFFQGYEADQLFRLLTVRTGRHEAELLLDKVRFEQWLVERGIPSARTAMVLADGAVVRSSSPDGTLPRCDLFSKPNDSYKGLGTQRWTYDGEGWVGADGLRRSEPELVAELVTQSRGRSVLVQQRLRNHPALAPLAPAALSTVRVLTLRRLDGRVEVVLAVCKIPTGDAPTDHMRLGGVAAPVDLATGRLGVAVRQDDDDFVTSCDRHPDTGVPIPGFQLPCWDEAKALAVRAHEALDQIVCVGWDVAILEDGPVIIEGNDNPGSMSSQIPTGIAMGETPVVPTLLARIEATFAR